MPRFSSSDSIAVFDGTSFFVESASYELGPDEIIVFRGSFEECVSHCEEQNDAV